MKEAGSQRETERGINRLMQMQERREKKLITAEAVLREMEKDKRDESKCAPY